MENRCLGDYEIVKQIGQGSFGKVFLAEHRFMKRPFVLKILPSELSSDRGFIQRFEEQVGALSTLEHPHIVKVHNVSFAEGNYFLVNDCVVDDMGETTNLYQYFLSKQKPFSEAELFELLYQIAGALDYAHEKKIGNEPIVHRTFKLNNVLIGKSEKGICVKISDFGLSNIIGNGAVLTQTYKMVAESIGIVESQQNLQTYPKNAIESQKLTTLHTSFIQNFAFLAPEQKFNNPTVAVTIKSDIYAFGVLVYFLFNKSYPVGVFPFPSQTNPNLKANWDFFLSSCLNKDPNQRPSNLTALLNQIKERQQSESKTQQGVKEHPIASKMQVKLPEKEVAAVSSAKSLKPIINHPHLERPEVDPDPAAVFKVDSTVKVYQQEENEVKNIEPIMTDMVIISGGTFWRGSNDGNRDEMPRHKVTTPSFAIDVHPVTNEQFARFLDAMGGEKDINHNDLIRLKESRIKRTSGKISIESGYSKHPVVGVTWYGAVAYGKWVGKRLPYEVEWEIASRGGIDDSFYPSGDELEKSQANFFSSDTTVVKSYAPNGYGLYDIAGNVYEWCYDWYGYNYYDTSIQEPEHPKGPIQGVYRVLRGGCWKSLKEDLRCSRRHRNNPGNANSTYGFRCVADVQE